MLVPYHGKRGYSTAFNETALQPSYSTGVKFQKVAGRTTHAAVKRNIKLPYSGPRSMLKNANWIDGSSETPEKKWIDVRSSTYTNIVAAGTFISLLTMGQGTGQSARVGNRIVCKAVGLRMKFRRNPTTPSDSTIRIMVFQYMDPSAVTPTAAILFPNSANGLDLINAPLNLFNVKRFHILKDVTQELDSGHGDEFFYQYYHKCALGTSYNESVTTPTSGDIWVAVFDEQFGTADQQIQMTYHIRSRYIDN